MLNSRLGRFTAASISLSFKTSAARHPFSRSYGVNLPSSLTRVLPIALVCSTRLPASVCGTDAVDLARRFSCRIGSVESAFAFHSLLGVMRGRICLSSPPTGLDAHSQSALDLPFPVTPLLSRSLLTGCLDSKAASAHRRPRPWHPKVQTISGGIGISTDCPSPTAFALGLGPTNPERINLPQETLDIRRARFSRAFRYSCRHSHFRPLQPSSRSTFTADGTLPYHRRAPEGGDDPKLRYQT